MPSLKRVGWLVAGEAVRRAMRSSGSSRPSAPRRTGSSGSGGEAEGCEGAVLGCGCLLVIVFFLAALIGMCGPQ